jgi:glutathione S-transferase
VPTARAKVPILEVGTPGEDGYFAMIESEVVARFVARNWQDRGTQLIPPHPNDEAVMNLFVTVFMENVSGLSTSFLGAKSEEQLAKGYEKLLSGLQSVENALNTYGNEQGGSFLFGGSYTLAESLTAPFVIRMCANFPHHRGVDVIESCERAGFTRAAHWMQAVLERPSSINSTPALNSLVMLAPYMQPFFEATVTEEMQTAAFDKLERSAADAEAAWEAQLAAGNAITTAKRGESKVHESIRKSAAKAKL